MAEDDVLGGVETSATLPLRIAAVFIIMAVSALGCLFPLLVLDLNGRAKFGSNLPLTPSSRNKSDGERVFHGAHAMHLLKSFSAGIILCVGFVHVLAEANETLGDLVDFPLAHFVAMLGSIVVLALSQVVDGLVSSMAERGKPPGPSAGAAGAERGLVDMVELVRSSTINSLSRVMIATPEPSPSQRAPYCFPEESSVHEDDDDHHHHHHHQPAQQQQQQMQQHQEQHLTPSQRQFLHAAGGNTTDSDSSSEQQRAPSPLPQPTPTSRKKPAGLHIDPPPPPRIPNVSPAATNTSVPAEPQKSYPFVSPRAQSSLKTALAARKQLWRQQSSFGTDGSHDHGGGGHNDAVHVVQAFKKHSLVIAYIMEVGIVFHSVLIGIGLGTATSSVSNTRTLLVAISVHQFFEGAGLSTCILEAHLPRKKNAIMFALFSITTSLGITLGIGISKIYDDSSREAALVEGIFNAFAAGILIYLALVDILQEEFNRKEVKKHKVWQIQMMMCVLLGAGVMSVIAIWA